MARKGENIYKRKDGRWEGRYIKSRSSTGKANYGYVYAKSYREVKAKLISQSSCTSNSVTVDPEISSDQFEQVAMEWFQAICPKVKESTSNKYRNLLSSYILPVFGSKQLRDITHEFIETQCNFFLVSGGLKENGLSSDVPDKYWKLYTYFVSKWVNREYRQLFTKNQFHQAMKHAKVNNLSTVTYEQVLSIFNSYLLFNGRK